jgi:hypothetical protein
MWLSRAGSVGEGCRASGGVARVAKNNPDLPLKEHCELFEETHSVSVSTATASRDIRREKRQLLPEV